MAQREYHQELNALSGIAILFVLLIHAFGSTLSVLFPNASSYGQTDLFMRVFSNLVCPAVPIFLFISGYKYFLNDQKMPYFALLKKRLPRVLMSFFIINTLFWVLDSIVWMERFDPILLLKTYISSWLGNTVAYPLWYIPMYCCVIIACPLVNRLLRNCWLRAALYWLMGLAFYHLAEAFPFLSDEPFRFVIYPLFFELGFIAGKTGLREKFRHPFLLAGGYFVLLALFSWAAPALSTAPFTKYLLFYPAGTLACYALSILLAHNRVLLWLSGLSYPLFLLHEPVIGRLCGSLLVRLGVSVPILFVAAWLLLVLTATLILIRILERLHVDRILWKFKLNSI